MSYASESARTSDESIDEQRLDDFLKDLQLSAGMIPDLFKQPTEEAVAPSPPALVPSESLLNNALDYLYPTPPRSSPRPLGVC